MEPDQVRVLGPDYLAGVTFGIRLVAWLTLVALRDGLEPELALAAASQHALRAIEQRAATEEQVSGAELVA